MGVVSDTHGLFDRKLVDLFRGSSFILHAGPIFGNCVESIAPTRVAETSWRLGDWGGWTQAQPSAGSPQ